MSGAAAPLVLSVFSTFAIGGPQVRFVTLANRLGGAFRHAIVAMDGATDCAARLAPGLDITWPEVTIRKGDTIGNVRRFRAALRAIRPDVMVTYNWGTIEWAMANALRPLVPQVHIEDGFGPEERDTQIPRRVLTRRAVLRRHTVVLPSRTLWRIATEVWRLPEPRLRYVPNGVDLSRFAPSPRRAGAGVTIGTVASLRAEKNLARLLRAFRALPEEIGAGLVIAGDGPERPGLQALATELGLGARVRFVGQHDDPAPLYRDFDIFAISSDTEQMPLSVLEAMAAGLPVAATAVGDIRAMLAEENADCVVPPDDAALAGALGRLATDPSLRARIGAANRAKAERDYDERQMVQTYRRLFTGA
jgi:glycosyltransferase involved in cell wall biosynthesis